MQVYQIKIVNNYFKKGTAMKYSNIRKPQAV